jgi:Tol biopolymer transport system component
MVCSVRVSHSSHLIALSLLVLLGCGGGDSPVAPETSLMVIAQTDGTQTDADGYSVKVGTGAPTVLGTNSTITIPGVQTGSQTVTLTGIAPNCAVTGDNPLTVQIQSGQNASVTFHLVCTATPGGTYRIALMTNRDPNGSSGAWEINSMNSDGSIAALTSNAFLDAYPVWSPDGQKIVFTSDRDGTMDIYVMNQDGSNVARLTTTAAPAQDRFATWSPDGTKIVFESNRSGGSEIYVMNADGSNVIRLTNNSTGDNAPQFSPDGAKIVFVSNRDAPSTLAPFGKWEVYVMNADGSAQTRITTDAAHAELPSFLGATRILFDSDLSGPNNIYGVNVDATSESRLTNNLATTFLAVASPDQKHIMFSSVSANHGEVFMMNPDGTGVVPLTRQQDGVVNLGYSYRK